MRSVLVLLMDGLCSDLRDMDALQWVAARTDAVPDPSFRFGSTAQALGEFGPWDSELCLIHADSRWEAIGGARAYIHMWQLGIEDLLARMRWIREADTRPHGRRVALPNAAPYADLEQKLCAAWHILQQARAGQMFTADFWRAVDAGSSGFWEVWWWLALTTLGHQISEPGPMVVADTRRRLDRLREAAADLLASDRAACLSALDKVARDEAIRSWLLEGDSPTFFYALDCLGLRSAYERQRLDYILKFRAEALLKAKSPARIIQ